MNSIALRRAFYRRSISQVVAARGPNDAPQPRNYESSRVSDQRRFEDEPQIGEDDQISK